MKLLIYWIIFVFIVSYFPSFAFEVCRNSFHMGTPIEDLDLSPDIRDQLKQLGVRSLRSFLSERERELPEHEQMEVLFAKLKAEWHYLIQMFIQERGLHKG